MVIKTTRFGQVQVAESDLLVFSEGILGFNDFRHFVLLDDPNDEIFAWLQSCEEASIAFPVLEPELFSENYQVTLAKSEIEALKLDANANKSLFCIVTIPDDPTMMTANLKAPIVINNNLRIAKQCVLQDNSLAIREPIFSKLQSRVVQNPDKSIKQQSQKLTEVAVRLPETANTSEAEL